MVALLCFVFSILASPFKSKIRLEAENTALRHQLIVLRRQVRGRVRVTDDNRLFLIQLYRWFPLILKAITIIRPQTLVPLASCRLPPVLALEIPIPGRPAANRRRPAGADPADQRGQSTVGRAAHPWRAAQARL